MKRSRKIITSLIVAALGFCCFEEGVQAAPCFGKNFTLKQPDNSTVQVRVFGDEFYQDIESLDGYTLCRNSEGWICYADLNNDKSEYIATDTIYRTSEDFVANYYKNSSIQKHLRINKSSIEEKTENVKEILNMDSEKEAVSTTLLGSSKIRAKAEAAKSVSGTENVEGLTLLIDFPDTKSALDKSEINDFFNKTGYSNYGNNGSVNDFFKDISGGKLNYTNEIVGFYTAKHNKSYYDDNSDYGHATEIITEALTWLESQGYDFSQLTTDDNGIVKGVNIFYAGTPDAGWAKGLWPHQGWLDTPFYADGVTIQKYEMSNIGSELTLGTVCHENGHLICEYPDLYDYDGDSEGCGGYSLMAVSLDEKNPTPPDAYCRNVISKWNNTYNLNSYADNSVITVKSNPNGAQEAYRWNGNNSNEYYLIENAKREGRYAALPDEGLMIWHVDERGDNSANQMTASRHYLVSLVQADNKFDLEYNRGYGEDGDLFHAGYKTEFNDTTAPNARWWDGSNSGLDISDISNIGSTMTFVKSKNGDYSGDDTSEKEEETPVDTSNNIASKATVSSSYCSSWESNDALNDGYDPTSSEDRAHAVYGNWPETGEQYVQYTFDQNYDISSTAVYWFCDNGGILAPKSCKIQYLDGTQWKNVKNASGCGTSLNTFNITTFDTVTTKAIRLIITSNGNASTGILEWRVFGKESSYTPEDTNKDDVITDEPSNDDNNEESAANNITVEMYNSNKSIFTNSISPSFKIVNNGDSDLDLSKVKLRYYYTADTNISEQFWCDWCSIGSNKVSGKFVDMPQPKDNADRYLEISFASNSGTIKFGEYVFVQTRFAKVDWSNYNQSNDISFDSSSSTYKANKNVSLYLDGTRVWGDL